MSIQDEFSNINKSLSNPAPDPSNFVNALMSGMIRIMGSLEVKNGKVTVPGGDAFLGIVEKPFDPIISALTVQDITSNSVNLVYTINPGGTERNYTIIIKSKNKETTINDKVSGKENVKITKFVDELESDAIHEVILTIYFNNKSEKIDPIGFKTLAIENKEDKNKKEIDNVTVIKGKEA